MAGIQRFRDFVIALTRLAEAGAPEAAWLEKGRALLAELVRHDDWLPASCAEAGPTYRQYLLHCDPLERFSVVSFVWGPGQRTPVHNHTVWGLVGMLRGEEVSTEMRPGAPAPSCDGARCPMIAGRVDRLRPGEVVAVSPNLSDIHVVENALPDAASISIHVYGANIGAVRRSVFDPATGAERLFVSGYSNAAVPNLWDRSAEAA
ncbi:cysteine dioxygenase [Falsiroseomonas sp.]|uniref:cysteine dioxygenase family protein n=1 Tax=Falsiroseomonas sp. TaxID=2870721 RepID=UPI003566C68C